MLGGARPKVASRANVPAQKKGPGRREGQCGKADLKGPGAFFLLPQEWREATLIQPVPTATARLIFVPTKLIFIKNSEQCPANKVSLHECFK